ncbi:MAG: transglutaminase-like domain-containing protein [Candidatus Omnitrophica bacterium]|nr:transglutaminase-like domain-containing protein [Candidatus Omnitrophota bacterium]
MSPRILFTVVLGVVLIGILMLHNRAFSHMAIWRIVESDRVSDFYWAPADAPAQFTFQNSESIPGIFKHAIEPFLQNDRGSLEEVMAIARYCMDSAVLEHPQKSLKWGDPESLLKQLQRGAPANCFHRAIIFSTFLESVGIHSRLWALEGRKFDYNFSHTINEVYVRSMKKWVFFDITADMCAYHNGTLLSFLELRELLLGGKKNALTLQSIGGGVKDAHFFAHYKKLVPCVFLRTRNDFVNKYRARYGMLTGIGSCFDWLPNSARVGLEYFLGGYDVFMHYVDPYNKTLKAESVFIKSYFYCMLIVFVVLLGMWWGRILRVGGRGKVQKYGQREGSV